MGAAAAGHSFSTAPRFVGSEIFCALREISAAAEIDTKSQLLLSYMTSSVACVTCDDVSQYFGLRKF